MSQKGEPDERREIMLPRILYKYRSWRNLHHKQSLQDLTVRFASPLSFNDPFDCMVLPDYGLLSDSGLVERCRSSFQRMGWSSEHPAVRALSESTHPASLIRALNDEISYESLAETVGNFVGVLSLTPIHNNMLMWSHYADSHRGFCIGYSTSLLAKALELRSARENLVFIPGKVRYHPQYPMLQPCSANWPGWIPEMYLAKAGDWAYEREVRIISLRGTNLDVTITADTVAYLIFGARMPPEHVKEITNCLADLGANPTLFRAKMKSREFVLETQPIV